MAEAPTKTADVDLEIPDQIRAFLYEPAVLEGEDPSPYWKMFAAMVKERKPETIMDWIALNDLTTKVWEERVLRQRPTLSFAEANC